MNVYLDAAASTPLDPAVLEDMVEVLAGPPSNPGSPHWAGRLAARGVRTAREHVAALADQGPSNVIFTSGATEANNLALRGLTQWATARGADRRGVVSARTEHPSILATLQQLAAAGVPVSLADVDAEGRVDIDHLRALVDESTLLVSLMAANNETGVLGDLVTAAQIAHDAGAYFHTDASQLLVWGPLPADVDADLVTVSGHKMHGPQGIGALIAARGAREQLAPLTTGGGQENGLRSGTINVAGVVGLGSAARHSIERGPAAASAVRALRDQLHESLSNRLTTTSGPFDHGRLRPGLPTLNGHPVHRLPGVLNVAFGNDDAPIDADQVLAAMPSVAASTGSACSAGMPGPSPVLLAMGRTTATAESSIRFSLSRLTVQADVEAAVDAVDAALHQLANSSSGTPMKPSDQPGKVPSHPRVARHPNITTEKGACA